MSAITNGRDWYNIHSKMLAVVGAHCSGNAENADPEVGALRKYYLEHPDEQAKLIMLMSAVMSLDAGGWPKKAGMLQAGHPLSCPEDIPSTPPTGSGLPACPVYKVIRNFDPWQFDPPLPTTNTAHPECQCEGVLTCAESEECLDGSGFAALQPPHKCMPPGVWWFND